MLGRRQLLALLAWPVACVHTRERPPEPELGLSAGPTTAALAAEMRRVPITMYMTTW